MSMLRPLTGLLPRRSNDDLARLRRICADLATRPWLSAEDQAALARLAADPNFTSLYRRAVRARRRCYTNRHGSSTNGRASLPTNTDRRPEELL